MAIPVTVLNKQTSSAACLMGIGLCDAAASAKLRFYPGAAIDGLSYADSLPVHEGIEYLTTQGIDISGDGASDFGKLMAPVTR